MRARLVLVFVHVADVALLGHAYARLVNLLNHGFEPGEGGRKREREPKRETETQ